METPNLPAIPSITLSPFALTKFLGFLSDWGVSVPTLDDNLERLQLWRDLLSGLTMEQRVAWAQTPQLMNAAIHYVPRLPSSDRARALDWKGFDPDQTTYEAEKAQLLALAQEQEEWIRAGLIPGPTQSSSEWPAVALFHACQVSGQSLQEQDVLAGKLIELRAPSLLRAALPLISTEAWCQTLVKPIHGHEGNPPLLHYLLDDLDLARQIRSRLTPDILNLRYGKGETILFRCAIPAQELPEWIDAGLDPSVRNESGEYPEERHAYMPRDKLMAHVRALNAYRSPEQAAEATWRVAARSFEYGLGEDPTTLADERLLDAVRSPPPGVSLAQFIGEIHYAEEAVKTIERLLHWMTRRLEREGRLDDWMSKPGHGHELLGQFIKRGLQSEGSFKLQPVFELADRLMITPEQLVIATLSCGDSPRHPLSVVCPSPCAQRQAREWGRVIEEVIAQPTLQCPDQWLELLPNLQDALIYQTSYQLGKAAPVVNLLAHVLSRLPRSQWDTPHMTGTLMALGVAEKLSDWDDFTEDCQDRPQLMADRQVLQEAFEQRLDQPETAQWWSAHGQPMEKNIEGSAPQVLSRIRRNLLSEIATPTQARPGGPGKRF